MSRTFVLAFVGGSFALLTPCAPPASGQTVSGVLYEDFDRDGLQDWGEPPLPGVTVTLFGNDGTTDLTTTTAADGTFSFSVATGIEYVLAAQPGDPWRMSFQDLGGDPHPIPDYPQGRRRPGVLDSLVGHLRGASSAVPLIHVALGDSIAFGFNLCDSIDGRNDYVTPLTARLDRASQGAVLQKLAVPGYETKDLLDPAAGGNVFDAISAAANLVTISIGGNDYLADDGNDALTAANLVSARQNLQEILSTLVTEIPDVNVILNTVYDNEAGLDANHNRWGPVWNQALRDVAWGQRRRVGIAEIWPDYDHLDPATGQNLGEKFLICSFFGFDTIHPKKRGYDLHEEKVWQGLGGLNVASGANVRNFGWLARIESRLPSQFTDLGGGASSETQAFAEDGAGALVPGGNQELRLAGFDGTPRGLLEQVVVRIRYRTTAPPGDDYYRFEASVDGTFSAPGSDATSWNTIVPIVGGAGNGAPVLAYANQPSWREVSALVTQGAAIDGQPTITWQDLANLSVRVKGTAAGSADAFDIEWDVAALDLYGIPPYRLFARGTAQIGGTLELVATGAEGALDYLFASSGSGNVPFPPWGTFLIDLSQFVIVVVGAVGPDGAHTLAGTIPNDPALVGQTAWFQSLVVEDAAQKIGALTNVLPVTFQ